MFLFESKLWSAYDKRWTLHEAPAISVSDTFPQLEVVQPFVGQG